MRPVFVGIFVSFFLAVSALAQIQPTDHEVEDRAREVGQALRCVICQNQSIEESDASLAEDMRTLVRARIRAGDTNQEVITYMQSRYGDYVLLKPPVQSNTYVLWFGPFILVLLGLFWFIRRGRAQAINMVEPLSEAEQAAFKELSSKK